MVRITNRKEHSATFIEISDLDALMEEQPVAGNIISVKIAVFITQTLLPICTLFPYQKIKQVKYQEALRVEAT